jgi:hypothetical protein
MLNQITGAVMVKLGYEVYSNNVMASAETGQNGEQVAGFYSTETGDAYINDQNIGNTEGLVTTAGHEAVHAMDQQEGIDITNTDTKADNDVYATNYGENLAGYTGMALDINGYDGGLASTNNHVGNSTSQSVQENNAVFSGLDKTKGDNALCGGICVGAGIAALYTIFVGEGDPVEGVETIGKGEDPISEGVAAGTDKAIEFAYSTDPEKTQAVMDGLQQIGNTIDATVEYFDESTGKVVSKSWNDLDENTQNQLMGVGKILSVVIPVGSVSKVKALHFDNGPDVSSSVNTSSADVVSTAGDVAKLEGKVDDVGVGSGNIGPDSNVVPPPKRNTGETVLGSYPEYVKLSDDLNARRFEIPVEQWNKMSPTQQWTANQKFLDRTINRGDSIKLSNNARDAKPGTYFHREIQYMQSKGYSVSNDGMSLLAPKQ